MRTKRRLTDLEREDRRAHARQRLKQAAEQLLSSGGRQRWVRARARRGLARYSVVIAGARCRPGVSVGRLR